MRKKEGNIWQKKNIFKKGKQMRKRKVCNLDVNVIEQFKKEDNKRKKEKRDNLDDNGKEQFKKEGNKRKKINVC